MGRRPNTVRSAQLGFRCSPEVLQTLDELAKREDRPKSQIVSYLVRYALRQQAEGNRMVFENGELYFRKLKP